MSQGIEGGNDLQTGGEPLRYLTLNKWGVLEGRMSLPFPAPSYIPYILTYICEICLPLSCETLKFFPPLCYRMQLQLKVHMTRLD
jgi:hypothetical protein